MITAAEAKSRFNQFMDGIPECIATVKKLLNKETLTYAVEELKEVEELYLRSYKTPELLGLEKTYFSQVFESYVGTAFLWHVGGKWFLDLDKRYTSFGRIYLIEYGGKGYHWVATSVEDWREMIEDNELEGGIHQIVKNQIRYFSLSPEYTLEPVRTIN
jgi:hypothetical protein